MTEIVGSLEKLSLEGSQIRWNGLAPDILRSIFSLIDAEDLWKCARCCRSWNIQARSENTLKNAYFQRYGATSPKEPWFPLFQKRLRAERNLRKGHGCQWMYATTSTTGWGGSLNIKLEMAGDDVHFLANWISVTRASCGTNYHPVKIEIWNAETKKHLFEQPVRGIEVLLMGEDMMIEPHFHMRYNYSGWIQKLVSPAHIDVLKMQDGIFVEHHSIPMKQGYQMKIDRVNCQAVFTYPVKGSEYKQYLVKDLLTGRDLSPIIEVTQNISTIKNGIVTLFKGPSIYLWNFMRNEMTEINTQSKHVHSFVDFNNRFVICGRSIGFEVYHRFTREKLQEIAFKGPNRSGVSIALNEVFLFVGSNVGIDVFDLKIGSFLFI
eukprot:TRINITY_DN1901_c0_g1_i5.p1 TRINITY_DN1901_c0_g1~~TRINITY_DN1901_c0_g1_i5.p1  ORF type:complete len:378 (-),score=56.72 TRINITY_DN1901_c0_g1_i5:583-1716(-)